MRTTNRNRTRSYVDTIEPKIHMNNKLTINRDTYYRSLLTIRAPMVVFRYEEPIVANESPHWTNHQSQ